MDRNRAWTIIAPVIQETMISLTLLAQLIACLMPCGVVLCVHDDGRSIIEWGTSLCCRADGSHADRAVGTCEYPCQDFPLAQDLVSSLRASSSGESRAQALPAGAPRTLPMVALVAALRGGYAMTFMTSDCGPPPDTPLRQLRTISLRR